MLPGLFSDFDGRTVSRIQINIARVDRSGTVPFARSRVCDKIKPEMAATLENASFHLTIDLKRHLFTVLPRQINIPIIENARIAVRYRYGLQRWDTETILAGGVSGVEELPSLHGELRTRTIRHGPNRHGLTFRLTFATPREHPLLLWKLEISNGGKRPVSLGKIEMLRVGFTPLSQADFHDASRRPPPGKYTFPLPGSDPAFFSNGWGSWNYTGVLGYYEKFRKTRYTWFNGPMRINPGTPVPRGPGHFASDMFAVLGDRTNRGGLLLGFLSQKQNFGSIEALLNPFTPALSLWANGDDTVVPPGSSTETDWACLQPLHLDSPDPLGPYVEAVMRAHGLSGQEALEVPVGWCSWYHYFQDISEPVIAENLARAAAIAPRVPLDLIQIDDGWQAQIGDWNSFSKGFPDGPAQSGREISSRGFTPGLWLAPFILHPASQTARKQPDWVLRGKLGLPANAGFVWDTFTRALDLSIPDALDYAVESVRRAAHDWGYPYLKLDFLYAGALGGRRADRSRTRAQVLRGALEAIRHAVGPDVSLLGCGCPLGPAIGLFEAMRINADVAPHWFPEYRGFKRPFHSEPDFPSARNAIQNALTRAPLHRRWWVNDPDCLLLRPDSDLSLPEIQSLATVISLTGGSILLSDDLAALPEDRIRIAGRLLPVIGQRPVVTDWFDRAAPARIRLDLSGPAGPWHLLAAFNWADRIDERALDVREFHLDPGQAGFVRSFWSGNVLPVEEGIVRVPPVAAHGCVLLAVRPRREGPQYLGSDLHISQGQELAGWRTAPGIVALVLERPGEAEGQIVLKLPGRPQDTPFTELVEGVYGIPVTFTRRLEKLIRYA